MLAQQQTVMISMKVSSHIWIFSISKLTIALLALRIIQRSVFIIKKHQEIKEGPLGYKQVKHVPRKSQDYPMSDQCFRSRNRMEEFYDLKNTNSNFAQSIQAK